MAHDTKIFMWKPNVGESQKKIRSCLNNYMGSTNFLFSALDEGSTNSLIVNTK